MGRGSIRIARGEGRLGDQASLARPSLYRSRRRGGDPGGFHLPLLPHFDGYPAPPDAGNCGDQFDSTPVSRVPDEL